MSDFLGVLEFGEGRYQPARDTRDILDRDFVLDQQLLARWVGYVAFGLPFVMLLGVFFGTCFNYSISHFYYTRFLGDVLVAALAFIATFLLAYRGENDKENRFATFAGFCAFGIAVLPTTGAGCQDPAFVARVFAEVSVATVDGKTIIAAAEHAAGSGEGRGASFFEEFSGVGGLHFLSAAGLFAFLAYYSFHVFTRVVVKRHGKTGSLTQRKTNRNRVYIGSGVVIVLSMAAIAGNGLYTDITGQRLDFWYQNRLTFWAEAFALWAFGVSWMVKGRVFRKTIGDPGDQL